MAGTSKEQQSQTDQPQEFVAESRLAKVKMPSGASIIIEDAPPQEMHHNIKNFAPSEITTKQDVNKAVARLQNTVGALLDDQFEFDVDLITSQGTERGEVASMHEVIDKNVTRFDARIIRLETMLSGDSEAKISRIRSAIREKAAGFAKGTHIGDRGDSIRLRSEALCTRAEKLLQPQDLPQIK